MAKVFCIGEALIDFVPTIKGVRMEDVPGFIPAPGGAPANLAAAVSKLGAQSAFIGKVGDDAFGRLLRETLDKDGVDTTYMTTTDEANTTLAFVALKTSGDRDFVFYRKPGADMLLAEADISEEMFSRGDILHFGSLAMVESPSKYAHIKALRLAKEAGAILSFDPNVRLPLWRDPADCKNTILEFLPQADLVKVSLDEMPFIFDTEDEQTVADRCFALGLRAVLITRGAAGSAIYTPGRIVEVESIDVKVEDTTGAGDAYTGAVLSRLVGRPLEESLTPQEVDETIALANVVGSMTTMHKGGIASIPTISEARKFMQELQSK